MTAQELADFLMCDPDRTIGQEQAAAMLRQQAEQLSVWLAANSPGGCIDDLRRENAALKADAERFVRMAEYLISDSTDHDHSILSAGTLNEMREVIDAMKGAT